MSSLLKLLRPVAEPVVAVLFVLFWVGAEAGRLQAGGGFVIALGLYGVGIALSRAVPVVAIAAIVLVPLLQGVGLLAAPTATGWPIAFAAVVVAFVIGLTGSVRMRWAALAAGLVQAALLGAVLVHRGDWVSWTGFGITVIGRGSIALQWAALLAAGAALLFTVAWAAGVALQVSAQRRAERALLAEAEAELASSDAELRSAQERGELAREVHDVVAHSLAVVVAVADGARYLRTGRPDRAADEPGRTDSALHDIASTARSALTDLRALLEGLDDEASRPQPRLDDLPALVERMSAAGMTVELETVGPDADADAASAALSPSQQLNVYRIVQEGLTNALKHGGDRPTASVSLTWSADGLALAIVSTGAPRPADEKAGRTFGLEGMADRARIAGGWLSAERDDGGAFLVTAFVPSRRDAVLEPVA